MRALPLSPASPPPGAGLRDLRGMIARQRWTVLASLALGAGAAAALIASTRPVYEASALIRVDDAPPGTSAAPRLDLAALLSSGGAGVGTEIEVLRTRTLAAQVADSLGLRLEVVAPRRAARGDVLTAVRVDSAAPAGAYRLRNEGGRFAIEDAATGRVIGTAAFGGALLLPGVRAMLTRDAGRFGEVEIAVSGREAALRALAGALEVSRPSREANLVRLTYRSTDPALARDVPNVLASRFVALRREVHTAQARATAVFLREQLDTLAAQLAESERLLQRFQQGAQVVDPETEGRTGLAQLAQLQAERGELSVEHDALAVLLADAERDAAMQAGADGAASSSPYRRLAAFPALMRNQTTAELLSSLVRIEDQRAALMTRRRPADPEVQALTTRIGQIEGELKTMADTYRRSLSGQLASLDGMLAESRGRLDKLPAKGLQFARLSRQPRVLGEMYSVLQSRLKEAEIAQAVDDPNVRVVDPAALPASPVSPRPKLIAGGALALALLLAMGIGWMREYADDTVHTAADLELAAGVPLLALVPRLRMRAFRRPKPAPVLAAVSATSGAAALPAPRASAVATLPPAGEAYDWLHTNLLFAASGGEMKTVLLTSAVPGEGKTTTAVNLALTMAQRGERVLLVDADLRRGRVAEVLGDPGAPGVCELVAGTVGIEDVLREADAGGGATLHYLAAGSAPQHPSQLLRSARMRLLVQWAARHFDRVVIDTPPVHVVADAAVLAPLADGVVLIARGGVTPFGALANAADQLRKAQAPLLGGVMNDVDYDRDARYDDSYRWYGHARGYTAAASA